LLHRYLQAISRIEKNIFSALLMPFGQRSLTPDSGVALRANFLAMDNDLKIISRRHSDDQ
jgi:hypothetical protein